MAFARLAAPLAFALTACRASPAPTAVAEPASAWVASPLRADAGAAPPASGAAGAAIRRPRPTAGHLSARAMTVTALGGLLIARDAAGNEAYLTADGADDSPALSPDGKTVVFRRHPNPEHNDVSAIYRVGVMEGDPELLVLEETYDGPNVTGIPLVGLSGPELSLDGGRVFFRVQNGRLGAVCALDLATRKVTWILTAIETELIAKGPYRGHFFAVRRETDTLDGPIVERCFVLHSVSGKKLRTVPCRFEGDASLQDPTARRSIGL